MRYLALATDYDGTLATHGRVDTETLAMLERLLASGRRLILVTGRELPDLMRVFPEIELFDLVVAENGALLYWPRTQSERVLGEAPPALFVQRLRERGVNPLSVGKSIVATWEPHQAEVLSAIHDLGLELQVIFNKGAVMILPSSVNKRTGLQAALSELMFSAHNVVGVGDAENDHAFLSSCECSAAVANALPTLKERADVVTEGAHGAGVREIIEGLLSNDLADVEPRLRRHNVLLGRDSHEDEVHVRPYGECILIAGPSGSGKSTVVAALLERLCNKRYQFCIVDPEGDFENLPGAITLGDSHRPVNIDEAIQLLEHSENATVNLLGVSLADRPGFMNSFMPRVQSLRTQTGRPHWLVLDEAHHLLPSSSHPAPLTVPRMFGSAMLITVHPNHVSTAALREVTLLLAVGDAPEETVNSFCTAVGESLPEFTPELGESSVLAWFRRKHTRPIGVRIAPGTSERRRHRRKYSVGDLQEKAFHFRGPDGKLNLRAQNLSLFLQIAEGVDESTWLHHLRQADYSNWIQDSIKDEELAQRITEVELSGRSAKETLEAIRQLIEQKYTRAA
jgi:hypothetical protein